MSRFCCLQFAKRRAALAAILSALALAVMPGAATAFEPLIASGGANSFGDASLSYQNGVVYDDDLVPGRGLNQEFLVGDTNESFVRGGSSGSRAAGPIPPNSRQLIGPDGRLLPDAGK